jgi:putative DNA primase/helicase
VAKHDIHALKLAIPLAELIEQHGVELKKHGADELVGLCPFHSEDTPSFTVEPKKGDNGLYYCMGCGEGGDQVKFLQSYLKIDVKDAIKKLAAIVGGDHTTAEGHAPAKKERKVKVETDDEWQITAAPQNEPAPTSLRVQRGGRWSEQRVVAAWPYRDAAGNLFAYDCRIEFEKVDGSIGKDIIPITWKLNTKSGETRWRQGSLPKPRLLYGTELLAQYPDRQVLIVEGCKTADAARRMLSQLPVVVVSWMGGCKAVKFADWQALAGRKGVIWPDCDSQRDPSTGEFKPYAEQSGVGAALEIAGAVSNHGGQIRIVEVPAPGVWPDGYDLADAEGEGRDAEWVMAYVRDHLKTPDELLLSNGHGNSPPASEVPLEQKESPPPIDEAPPPGDDYPDEPDEPRAQYDSPRQPFRMLGFDRIACYYLPDGSEQIVELTASGHTKNNLLVLAPLAFWEQEFPSGKRSGDGVDWTMATNALIQRSQAVGIYDPDLVRGRGAWWEDGRWAVHLGDVVIIDGKSYPLKKAPTRYIYEKSRPMPIQFENPLPTNEANKLVKLCDGLKWAKPIQGKLLAGWIFLAPICGALNWRPHIWVTGKSGSGKTTVMDHLIGKCLKGFCRKVQGDTTEAGLRQSLVHDAMPVVFDEFESDRRKAMEKVDDVLSMVTRASSETDSQLLKGSGDGKVSGYKTRAMFCFSSVAVNIRQFAAATRISVLELVAEPDRKKAAAHWKEYAPEMFGTLTEEYCQRLQARAVHMIPEIRKNAVIFAEAAAITLGSQRMGDQIGALLAGVYALHATRLITRDEAIEFINRQNWDDVSEVNDSADELSCIAHIVSAQLRVETHGGQVSRTIGELIQRGAGIGEGANDMTITADVAIDTLKRHGIKVEGGYKAATVSFANRHRELQRILQGTAWEASYARTLLRVVGAERHEPLKYGGATMRGVRLPVVAVV